MRQLRVVPAGDEVPAALRDALAGGPAIFVAADGSAHDLPSEVEQRIALVVESSGSTGRPKRVALGADALLANAAASESALGAPGQWVLALPTHYIAGLNVLTRSLVAGLDPVVVRGGGFTAAAFVQASQEVTHAVRYTALVPAQLATLLEDAEARDRLAEYARVLVGGQATPRALLERAGEHGIRVTRTYGSTETSGGCVYDGQPIGTTAVRIDDGEVWLGGPSLAEGYLDDAELTAARFPTADGIRWFATADSGTWDGERLSITGRRDDVIISGGLKVSLAAVERVLREQPGFGDAVVVGAPDPRWGEVPVVFTESAAEPSAAIAAIAEQLGAAARPASVIRLTALPMLASGKPDRQTLQALAFERTNRAD
ncbi:MAG: AMP-binding protein [Kofleriaceae bacterium]